MFCSYDSVICVRSIVVLTGTAVVRNGRIIVKRSVICDICTAIKAVLAFSRKQKQFPVKEE